MSQIIVVVMTGDVEVKLFCYAMQAPRGEDI
jgi:hypothetical protein